MVGHERPCRGAAGNALQDRSLHLQAAGFVEILPHRGDNLGALHEDLAHLRVHDEVHVPLPVAQLGIREGVEHLSVGFLDDRQYAQGLAQQGQLLGVHAQLAGLGDERKALDAYDVADVQKLFPDGVVHRLVFQGADFIALDINLDASALVLQLAERGGAHNAPAHQTASDADFLEVVFLGAVASEDFGCSGVDRVFCSGIWLNAQFSELRQRFAANLLLFAKFNIHNDTKVRKFYYICEL